MKLGRLGWVWVEQGLDMTNVNKVDRSSSPFPGHVVTIIQEEGKYYPISFPSAGDCVDTVCTALDKCPICPFPNLVPVFACVKEGK